MQPTFQKQLRRRLPAALDFPYFRGREAAWILRECLPGPVRIASLRRGPLSPLLDRAGVKDCVRACGDGRLQPDDLLPLADPWACLEPGRQVSTGSAADAAFAALCAADTHDLQVTFDCWETGGRDWYDQQTSRRGGNLVIQVNFPDGYGRLFNRLFGFDARRLVDVHTHPVRRSGAITMSWVRLDMDPGSDEVLIEEIQSDWIRRLPLFGPELARQVPRAERGAMMQFVSETIARYAPIWAEATMLAALAVGRRYLGARQFWLYQPHSGVKLKRIDDAHPPRSLYTDLPRRFRFRPTDRAPDLLYRARSRAVARLRRAPRPAFWQLDLDAPVC